MNKIATGWKRGIQMFAATLAASPFLALGAVVVTTAPESVDNGETAPVVANVIPSSEVSSVWLWFSLAGAPGVAEGFDGNCLKMSPGANAGEYVGVIPRVPAGTLSWYVRAEYSNGEHEDSSTHNTTISSSLTQYKRTHDMRALSGLSWGSGDYYVAKYGWQQDGGSTSSNFYANAVEGATDDSQRWKAHCVSWAYSTTPSQNKPTPPGNARSIGSLTGSDFNNSKPFLYFWNALPVEKPSIRTPKLDGGIGFLTFTARNMVATTSKLRIQVSYLNNPSNNDDDWHNMDGDDVTLVAASTDYPITNTINDVSAKYLRIIRTSINSAGSAVQGVIPIDNIAVSPASADIALFDGDRIPSAPVTGKDITIQCLVSNLTASTPAFNKSVTAYYAYASTESASVSSWAHVSMSYAGETNGCTLFTATLPFQLEPGYYHYYYKCDFDGYFYRSKTDSGFNGTRYLYGEGTTPNEPSASSQHLSIHVPERTYVVTINSSPSIIVNGHTETISGIVSNIVERPPDSVKLLFSLDSSDITTGNWNYIEILPNAVTGEFLATIPILTAGTLTWYVKAEYANDEPEPSRLQTTTITPTLDYTRYHDMKGVRGNLANPPAGDFYDADHGWQHESNYSSNFFANAVAGTQEDSEKWIAHGVGWGVNASLANNTPPPSLKGRSFPSLYGSLTAPILYLRNLVSDDPPFIRTPKLIGGAGRVSFTAHNQYGKTNKVKVQVCYTDSPIEWEDIASFEFTTENRDYPEFAIINDLTVKYVRIVRDNYLSGELLDYGVIGIDDFEVTPASPDVSLQELFRNPGYPAIGQDITLRCAVSNISETTPAINISVKAFYYLANNASATVPSWQPSITMDFAYRTNGVDVFECKVPAQSATGWLHYYFMCEFEGYCYQSKQYNGWNSPEFFNMGPNNTPVTTQTQPPYAPPHLGFEVRSSQSRYSSMKLETIVDGEAPTFTDMILVGDHQWQATIPVGANTTPNAYFVGYGLYEDGADGLAGYARYYGDNDQEFFETPSGGVAETKNAITNGITGISINVSKDGFLIYNLEDNDSSPSYTVRKGFYQDFNTWVVNGDYYMESHSGMTIGEKSENFESWISTTGQRVIGGTPTEKFLTLDDSDLSSDVPPNIATDFKIGADGNYSNTPYFWQITEARYSTERTTNSLTIDPSLQGIFTPPFPNRVAQIKQGGELRSTTHELSQARGLGEISAVMRAAIGDNVKAIYNGSSWTYDINTSSWATDIAMFAEVSFDIPLDTRPNSHYYFSFIYDYQNENNYHEVRYIRNDANSANDNRVRVEFYRCVNGTATYIAGWDLGNDQIKQEKTILLKLRRRNNTSTQSRMEVGIQIGTWVAWNNYNAQANSSSFTQGGKIGFCAYDCAPRINYIKVYGGKSGDPIDISRDSDSSVHDTTFEATASDWSFGNATKPEWYLDSDGALRRRIPEMTADLYVKPVDTPEYNLSHRVKTFTLNELTFKDFSHAVHSSESKTYRLRVTSSDGNYVVVDQISGSDWRATNRSKTEPEAMYNSIPYYEWIDPSTQSNWMKSENQKSKWLILEGWAKTNSASATFTAAAFQKSQANTNLVQGLVSPVMHNGIGSVMFNYRVSGDGVSSGKIVYAIEYSNSLGTPSSPDFDGAITAMVVTNTLGSTGTSGSKTCDINRNYGESQGGEPINMRLRIRVIPEETDPDVILWLDDVVVTDYPEAGDDTWEVYNGRIASAEDEPSVVYGHSGKTLFLNNSATAGLAPRTNPLVEKRPCVQAPMLDTGIGEVAFAYRALTSGAVGHFTVAISDNKDAPEEDWQAIASATVANTSGYVSFDNMAIHKSDKYFVRIFAETNGYGRICIDNILVAEPIDPTFKITSVTLTPKQPTLSSTNLVSVKASIGDRRLGPKNIRLFASHLEDTNVWGFSNWCDYDPDNAVELFPDSTGTNFASAAETGLPQDIPDGVVQYVVWGFAENSPPDTRVTERPDCFTPIGTLPDLNEEYGSEQYWSPYYYIMETPFGAVWFNEVWVRGKSNTDTKYPSGNPWNNCDAYEFIELAGTPGTKIGGWRIEFYKTTSPVFGNPTYTFTIPEGTRIGSSGLWVVGDVGTPYANAELDGKEAGKTDMFQTPPNEIVLVRNNGIIEGAVYSRNDDTAVTGKPFPYGGEKDGIASVFISSPAKTRYEDGGLGCSYSLMDQPFQLSDSTSDYNYSANTVWTNDNYNTVWYWTLGIPSPGAPNYAYRTNGTYRVQQTLPWGGVVPSSFRLVSQIVGAALGKQNGGITDIDIEVDSGESATIVYVANNWYKINALVSNGNEIPAARNQSQYTFTIDSMSADTENYVYFTAKTAADFAANPEESRWTEAILEWFRNNGWSESDIALGDNDGIPVKDEYLLNTDPTVFTEVDCRTTSFSIGEDTATLGLHLVRKDGGYPVTSPVNGVVNVYGVAELADFASGATKVSSASGATGLFNSTTDETADFSVDGLGLNFFIWKIE